MDEPFVGPRPFPPSPAAPGARRTLSAAELPSQRAIAVMGLVSWLSRRLKAISRPAIPIATSRMKAPTGVIQSDGPSARKVPTLPPPAPIGGAAGRATEAAPSSPP